MRLFLCREENNLVIDSKFPPDDYLVMVDENQCAETKANAENFPTGLKAALLQASPLAYGGSCTSVEKTLLLPLEVG